MDQVVTGQRVTLSSTMIWKRRGSYAKDRRTLVFALLNHVNVADSFTSYHYRATLRVGGTDGEMRLPRKPV